MTNKEKMDELFSLYHDGLISREALANSIKSINEPEQRDTLVIDEDILNNDLYKTDEARKLAQESRNKNAALRERIAQRAADRLEREAKEKREAELKAIHDELSDDKKIIVDILSSFKNRVTEEPIYNLRSLQHMSMPDLLKLYNDMEINAPISLKQIIDSKGYTEWAERRAAKEINEEVENTNVNSEPELKVDDKADKLVVDENQSKHEKSMNELGNMGLSQVEGKDKDESNVDEKSIVPFDVIGDDEDEKDIMVEPIASKELVDKSDLDHTLVMGKDVVENENGELVNTEEAPIENAVEEVEQSQQDADLTPEPRRLVTVISGIKNKLKEIYDSNPKAAVAACVAIGVLSAGSVYAIGAAGVGFTALGTLASGVGSAGLIGSGSALSAAAGYEYNKTR